jgi:hypothetical protein
MAGEIGDAAERAQALTALAVSVDEEALSHASATGLGRYELLADALRAARAIEGDYYLANRAMALTLVGIHLPKVQRLSVLDEASNAAWLVIRQIQAGKNLELNKTIKALAAIAVQLESHKHHPMADVVADFARNLTGSMIDRSDALATVAICYQEPYRTNMLREAVLIARNQLLPGNDLAELATALPEADRVTVLSEAVAEARRHDGYYVWTKIVAGLQSLPGPVAYQVLRIAPSSLTTRPRENLLGELEYIAPIIFALGGRSAVAEILDAIGQTARWWP